MRRPRSTALLVPALLLACAGEARAQGSPLSLHVGAGGVAPAGSFSLPAAVDGEVDGGTSFGVHFDYRARRRSGVYVGFSQQRFGCAGEGCPGGGEYVHTGWDVGGRFDVGGGPVRSWVRLGAVFARVERRFEVDGGDAWGVSDLSAGAEAGLGVGVPVGRRFHLEGGGRYVWLNADFPGEGLMRMRYFVTALGLAVRF